MRRLTNPSCRSSYAGIIPRHQHRARLTIGAVLGHWVPAVAIIILATIVAGYRLWSGSRAASLIMVAISGLTLLYAAYS